MPLVPLLSLSTCRSFHSHVSLCINYEPWHVGAMTPRDGYNRGVGGWVVAWEGSTTRVRSKSTDGIDGPARWYEASSAAADPTSNLFG